ncbi:MAG: hypothetical protein PHE54_00025 [Bacilli bacterium]|nr:hypothetical protein [Bacilli bacterium]
MKRYFEKISYNQFKTDISSDNKLYDEYSLPKRGTKNSAGYDFWVLESFTIKPGEIKKIPTGIKANMQLGEVLTLYVRSSVGFKYNIRMTNQVGIIDGDYFNNKNNEGHIWFSIQNEGKNVVSFTKGDRLIQGIFINYLTCDNDTNNIIRLSGIGSTN